MIDVGLVVDENLTITSQSNGILLRNTLFTAARRNQGYNMETGLTQSRGGWIVGFSWHRPNSTSAVHNLEIA